MAPLPAEPLRIEVEERWWARRERLCPTYTTSSEIHAVRDRAVDDEVRTGREGGGRTRQEHRCIGDFLRRRHAAGRVARQRILVALRHVLLDHVPDAALE